MDHGIKTPRLHIILKPRMETCLSIETGSWIITRSVRGQGGEGKSARQTFIAGCSKPPTSTTQTICPVLRQRRALVCQGTPYVRPPMPSVLQSCWTFLPIAPSDTTHSLSKAAAAHLQRSHAVPHQSREQLTNSLLCVSSLVNA